MYRLEMLLNYTDIPLAEALKEVGWLGKNFVPDRDHPNLVDISAGHSRLVRDMRWDSFFQQQNKENTEGESESEAVYSGSMVSALKQGLG